MTSTSPTTSFDVAIVGAGPVGVSAAIDLARRGRRVIVLERRAAPSDQPRAHVVNARTMEIFRGWGVADAIKREGLHPELARGFSWLTSMSSDALATLDYVDEATAERHSPERLCSCPQDLIESVLLQRLAEEPTATVRFDHEVTAIEQRAGGVDLTVRAADDEEVVTARFVLGADGANSTVRTLIGAGLSRSDALGRRANIYFHADLSEAARDRPNILWFILSLETSGIFIALNGRDRWVYSVEIDADTDVAAEFTEEYCLELIRTATGVPDLVPEIQSVLPWRVDMAIADHWRVGSVFLIGDAAHQFPPMGGFGMNSGIQDAHNIAWKLDAVLAGTADESLLDSYEDERRDVAVYNANRSMENAKNQQEAAAFMSNPEVLRLLAAAEGDEMRAIFAQGVEQQRAEFHSQGQQFGFVYSGSAIVDDGTPIDESTVTEYVVSTHPGARAPHARLAAHDGRGVSTIDLFDGGWTLLSNGSAQFWAEAAAEASSNTGVLVTPAAVLPVAQGANEYVDERGDFAERYALAPGAAVLIRPDGHVAARWQSTPVDAGHALGSALALAGLRGAAVPAE
ncbi:FAD-dependent oxidoreductase [Lysinimonas soli]|uniref:FAD-dependent oxidoreductase n=1 Tax=Lysinimonas soli TaxID=1074233 RepID=A0ABW0NMC1_9MICO